MSRSRDRIGLGLQGGAGVMKAKEEWRIESPVS